VVERIEQIRPRLVERHENVVVVGIEGAEEIDRPGLVAIGEYDDVVEAHERAHQGQQRFAGLPVRGVRLACPVGQCAKKCREIDPHGVFAPRFRLQRRFFAALGVYSSHSRFTDKIPLSGYIPPTGG
jgi:hypothetical protein